MMVAWTWGAAVKVQMGLNMWYRWSQGLAEGLDLRGREELLLVLSLSTWEKGGSTW